MLFAESPVPGSFTATEHAQARREGYRETTEE